MNAFLIELDNQVGELARVTEAVAAKGINITGFTGATAGSQGSVVILTDDEAATRTALQGIKCSFKELEITKASLPNVPGALAKIARRLADGGVNIEAALPTGMEGDEVVLAFVTSDPVKARSILSTAGSAAG